MSQHLLGVCVACLCLCTTQEAAASELIVEWIAPPECPNQAHVVSIVERSLGSAAKVNLTATANVTRATGTYRAEVRITSSAGSGQRILESPRCELLAESVALVIALSAPRVARPSRELARDAPSGGLEPELSLHAAALTGPLPRLAVGAGGAVAVEGFAALRLELNGTYYAHQTATFDDMNIGADLRLLGIGLRGCRIWNVGAFELAPCLGAQLYWIAGKGFGGMVSRGGDSLVWGPALGVFGRLRLLRRLALYLAADGVAPIARQRFVFPDVGVLHRPAAWAFQLFIGPEVRL